MTGRCTTHKTENERQDRQQATESRVPVLAPTHSYQISKFILPRQLQTLVCVAMLAEAAPLTERHSIYLSPSYLSNNTSQA